MDSSERLIVETQRLLWEQGYVATSPREIQQRAEVGQGSFYHHFRGKADLAAIAVSRSAQELQDELDKLLSGSGSPLARLITYLRRERDVLRGCPIGSLVQDPGVRGQAALRDPVAETFTWLNKRLSSLTAEAQQRGELPSSIDPQQLASVISATVQGGYVLARAENDPESFSRATDGLVELLVTLGSAASNQRAA